MDLGVRRALEVLGEVVPRLVAADRAAADLYAEVGACELREHVRDRVLADRGLERSRGMAEKPVGHETAVRKPEDSAAISVGETLLHRPISNTHDVAGVLVAPSARNGAGVCLAITRGASWVGPYDGETDAGQRGHLQPGRGSVRQVGTAVHGDDQRSFARFAIG